MIHLGFSLLMDLSSSAVDCEYEELYGVEERMGF